MARICKLISLLLMMTLLFLMMDCLTFNEMKDDYCKPDELTLELVAICSKEDQLKAIFKYGGQNYSTGTATVDGMDILFSETESFNSSTGMCEDISEGWSYSTKFVVSWKHGFVYFKWV